jgi:putative ABC transport system ATP-binding protein
MMITHSIDSALRLGTRTIMLDAGKIVLDLSGSERDSLDVAGLLELYRKKCGRELANDRMLLERGGEK